MSTITNHGGREGMAWLDGKFGHKNSLEWKKVEGREGRLRNNKVILNVG